MSVQLSSVQLRRSVRALSIVEVGPYTPFIRSSKHQADVFKIHVRDVWCNCLMFAWCLF